MDTTQPTRAELQAAYDDLTARIQTIDAQLGARKPIGYVPDNEWREYREWKAKATFARLHLIRERQELRPLLTAANNAIGDDVQQMASEIIEELGLTGNKDSCAGVYRAVRRVLDAWEADDVDGE